MKLERLDARVKLIILAAVSSVSVISRSIPVLLLLLALTLAMLLFGGVAFRNILSQAKVFLRMILILFVIQCIFNRQGEPLLTIGSFTVFTSYGVETAILVAARLLIILLSALIVLTGDMRDYLLALTQWHLPYELAYMVIVAFRFIPILREEAQDVMCAVQMRGVAIKTAGIRKKLSIYTSVMIPIVAGAIHRAENTSIAMEARAFRSNNTRTYMRRIVMTRRDWTYLLIFSLMLVLIIFIGGA